jgi:uncharacterized membrane protein YraQ (UPF0718 family)
MDNFIIILISILLEAFPFVLLGALLSGIVEVFVPSSFITRVLPKNGFLAALAGAIAGVGLPMCECGSVLVVRRLIKKGMPTSAALSYMLAAPIINPVTLLSTYTAYAWFKEMVLFRAGLGASVAIITGFLISLFLKDDILRRKDELQFIKPSNPSFQEKTGHAIQHAMDDFMSIFSMLLIGATVVAIFKAFAPLSAYEFFQKDGWLGVPLASALAVLFSLCSEADAFVSASMNGFFDLPAQLAFLVLGPMLDLKLAVMYHRAFKRQAFFILCIIPPVLIISSCLLIRGRLI